MPKSALEWKGDYILSYRNLYFLPAKLLSKAKNAAINFLGLDLVYFSIPCKEKDFEIVINSLSKINCRGLNVTIPFKEKVINCCNEISPLAKKINSVNTLKLNDKNQWYGINTDVEGLIHPIKHFDFKNKKGIVLGSGGASRSAIQGLIDLKISEIIIISRNNLALNKILNDFKNKNFIKGILSNDLKILIDISENNGPKDSLIMIGISAWGGNQLEGEFERNQWSLAEIDLNLIFKEENDNKWNRANKKIFVPL